MAHASPQVIIPYSTEDMEDSTLSFEEPPPVDLRHGLIRLTKEYSNSFFSVRELYEEVLRMCIAWACRGYYRIPPMMLMIGRQDQQAVIDRLQANGLEADFEEWKVLNGEAEQLDDYMTYRMLEVSWYPKK